MDAHGTGLTARRILAFWLPLAATWLMMAAEGPFLTALMARLAEPKFNLAAFGVAFSLAMMVEAPIIMMLSAATALARDRRSFAALRSFVYRLNAAITVAMLVLLSPPVFRPLAEQLIGLPANVAGLANLGLAILLPWPAAIGFRRFYQGVMIRQGLTRRVAYGTVVRLSSMALTGGLLYALTDLPGIAVGAAALSTGVVLEAAATRVMAAPAVRRLLSGPEGEPLAQATIAAFYWPLALTSLLTLGVQPLVTVFLGRSRNGLESLAVLPVLHALVFIFRSPGLALQEVVIALIGEGGERAGALRRFATGLGAALTAALAVLALTPLAGVWLERVAGLPPELAALAVLPLRILCLMPGLEVLLSWQRALLLVDRRTALITWGTAVEIGGIVAVLAAGILAAGLVGITAAAIAILAARLAANAFLASRL